VTALACVSIDRDDPVPVTSATGGIQFDETMKGYLSVATEFRFDETPDTIETIAGREAAFRAFAAQRREHGIPTSDNPGLGKTVFRSEPFDLVFRLNVKIASSKGMARDPDHAGTLKGEVDIAALSEHPLLVDEGNSEFHLFADTTLVEATCPGITSAASWRARSR
jgi:hypothetical protein